MVVRRGVVDLLIVAPALRGREVVKLVQMDCLNRGKDMVRNPSSFGKIVE